MRDAALERPAVERHVEPRPQVQAGGGLVGVVRAQMLDGEPDLQARSRRAAASPSRRVARPRGRAGRIASPSGTEMRSASDALPAGGLMGEPSDDNSDANGPIQP